MGCIKIECGMRKEMHVLASSIFLMKTEYPIMQDCDEMNELCDTNKHYTFFDRYIILITLSQK